MPKPTTNTVEEIEAIGIEELRPIRMLLRDRDTGDLVLNGTMDADGQLSLLEVGEGYISLLRQIGVDVGTA